MRVVTDLPVQCSANSEACGRGAENDQTAHSDQWHCLEDGVKMMELLCPVALTARALGNEVHGTWKFLV